MNKGDKPSATGVPISVYQEEDPQVDSSKIEEERRIREKKEEERRIRARIMQIRFFSIVFLTLLLSTLYVAGLNAYAVWNSWPQPYRLKAIHSMGEGSQTAYRVNLDWVSQQKEKTKIVRPDIRLQNGELLPPSSQEGLLMPLGSKQREISLEIILPQKATPAMHEGSLVFRKDSGPESLPEMISLPVRLEVSRWKNWWPLGIWFGVILGVFAIFYLGSLLIFPKPQGFLKVSVPDKRFECIVPLTKKWIANILPWTRSTVDLDRVWSRLKGKSTLRLKGYLLFDLHNMAPAIVVNKSNRFMIFEKYKTYPSDPEKDRKYLTPCNRSTRMIEGKMVLAGTDKEAIEIVFEFQKQKYFAQI